MGNAEIDDIVYALAASPNFAADGVCFAARYSGLYRSEDGGQTWHDAYASLDLHQELPTTAVAVSPNFVRDGTVFAGAPGGILRSADRGETWIVEDLPSPPPFVSIIGVSPNFVDDGTLFAGTLEDGVFRSNNRGRHWAAWNFGLLDLNILCLAIAPDFAASDTLFVGTDSAIFRSTNGGRAWREVDFPTDWAPVLSLATPPSLAGNHNHTLLAGTESHGLCRSEDGGQSWERINLDHDGPVNVIVTDTVGSPTSRSILLALDDRLVLSRDGGRTWSSWGNSSDLQHGIACVTAPQGLTDEAPLLVGLVEGGVVRA